MLVRGDEDAANQIATVGSLFVGFVSLLLALADFFRHEPAAPDPAALADDLAVVVEEQWRDEATARGLRDPRVLPLAWTATDRDVAHLPRTAHARVLRVRLGGRLDGRFEDVIARLADGYRNLPGRRLVAIGEPGSGKSVLAILLTLGLLAGRESGAPVPVLLPASSWDPVREPLDDWIVGTLALPYYSSRPEIPRTLLAHGLLLPVLDGLDEIPGVGAAQRHPRHQRGDRSGTPGGGHLPGRRVRGPDPRRRARPCARRRSSRCPRSPPTT